MVRVTVDLLKKRAEHNDFNLATLEEISLHQQNLERIELINQLCPKLKILYLQNNLIAKISNLNRLKELEYLNLALNNLRKIENLHRCESLCKLDLTMNFIEKEDLKSISNLENNVHLKELHLLGNPCTQWEGYRDYVISMLPQLKRLDGEEITHSERLKANCRLHELKAELSALQDIKLSSTLVEDCNAEILETGRIGKDGVMRRPWCPETRVLDHKESESEKKRITPVDQSSTKTRREDFDEIEDGEKILQRNEGDWEFSMEESENRKEIVLEVKLSPFLDISLIKTDIQSEYIRLLIKGKLLQLRLPCQVLSDFAQAERSLATGRLVIKMLKESVESIPNPLYLRPSKDSVSEITGLCKSSGQGKDIKISKIREVIEESDRVTKLAEVVFSEDMPALE